MKFCSHQKISLLWPVKMANDHFPNGSHNFAYWGFINHDRMTALTLQTEYQTNLPFGYPKFAYPLEIFLWIRNLFTHSQTLPDCRFGAVYRDVITGSRESRVHHYDESLIYRTLKSLLPRNNTFFIATASVVKNAADDPDCQGLREHWYYLLFYVQNWQKTANKLL